MAQDKGKDFPKMALERLVEARRKAVESIAKGQQLEKQIALLTSAQAGIDLLNKAKAEIDRSFKDKMTTTVFPKEPTPVRNYRPNEDNGN